MKVSEVTTKAFRRGDVVARARRAFGSINKKLALGWQGKSATTITPDDEMLTCGFPTGVRRYRKVIDGHVEEFDAVVLDLDEVDHERVFRHLYARLNSRLAHIDVAAAADRVVMSRLRSGREIFRYSFEDRLLQKFIMLTLESRFESALGEPCHSYRRGRSVETATAAMTLALRRHGPFLQVADVSKFFPSISDETLLWAIRETLPALDGRVRAVVLALVRPSSILVRRSVPLNPSGPLLSGSVVGGYYGNLVAAALIDQPVEQHCGRWVRVVRYGDDVAVVGLGASAVQEAMDLVRSQLAAHGLDLKVRPDSGPININDSFVDVLGRRFQGRTVRLAPSKVERFARALAKIDPADDIFGTYAGAFLCEMTAWDRRRPRLIEAALRRHGGKTLLTRFWNVERRKGSGRAGGRHAAA